MAAATGDVLTMKITDLPDPTDPAAIFEFAMTFDGYEHFGSFEASAEAAESEDRSTLDLIRNELFFEARASRHRGDDLFVDSYQRLLPLFTSYLR